VAELCRREGISANVYYVWLKGEALRGATSGEVVELRRQNEALRQSVADLHLEVRALKKSLF
jgi:transposase